MIVLTTNGNFSFNTNRRARLHRDCGSHSGTLEPIRRHDVWLLLIRTSHQRPNPNLDFASAIPTEFFYMLPYIVTLLALIFTGRKTRGPKALGVHYDASVR